MLVPVHPFGNLSLVQRAEMLNKPAMRSDFLRYTAPFDLSGSPTITLPGGFTPAGCSGPTLRSLCSAPLAQRRSAKKGLASPD